MSNCFNVHHHFFPTEFPGPEFLILFHVSCVLNFQVIFFKNITWEYIFRLLDIWQYFYCTPIWNKNGIIHYGLITILLPQTGLFVSFCYFLLLGISQKKSKTIRLVFFLFLICSIIILGIFIGFFFILYGKALLQCFWVLGFISSFSPI